MKKLLALLMVLVMVFTLAACGKKTEEKADKDEEETEESSETESTGETEESTEESEEETTEPEETKAPTEPQKADAAVYVLVGYAVEGQELTAEEILEAFGEAPELKINGDGTAVITMGGDAMDMEYDDSYIWPKGEEADKESYETDGQNFRVYDDEGNEMVFSKVANAPVISDDEPAKVEGAYYCTGALIDNTIYSAADLEMENAYVILNGDGTAIMFDGEEEAEMGYDDEYIWEAEYPDDKIMCEITEDSMTWDDGEGTQIFFEK